MIDRSITRILAFINIVGSGMRGGKFEQNLEDMDAQATAAQAMKYPRVIVGIKTARCMTARIGFRWSARCRQEPSPIFP